jgi:hypothetical protein
LSLIAAFIAVFIAVVIAVVNITARGTLLAAESFAA